MGETESFASVLRTVRTKYRLDQLLLPSEPVLLTYDFLGSNIMTGGYTAPPVEIKEDGDVELFMALRIDHVRLELYVTFGNRDVDLYRRQRTHDEGDVDRGVPLSAPRRVRRNGKEIKILHEVHK